MALRLQSAAFKDLANQSWTIEIHDSDYVAGTVDFDIKEGSSKLKYSGNAAKTFQAITPTSLSFTFMVENAIHELFLTDLVNSPEDEFTTYLKKGSITYWAGRLIVDQVGFKDQGFPYELQLTASCGLSILKNVEYWDDGTPYAGSETYLGHIQNVLSKIGTDFLWDVTDDYLITNMNWFEDHHSSPDDPLAAMRVSHEVFYEVGDDGQKDHMSCYEVLENILISIGANIRISAGAWYVHQLTEYANSTQRRTSYYKTGLQKAHSAAQSYDITVDQTRTSDAGSGRWRTNGNFRYTPQLREVKLIYDNTIPSNLILNQEWNHVTGSDLITGGTLSAGAGDVTLTFTGSLNISMSAVMSSYTPHLHKFQFLIKVGSYYLIRTSQWFVGGNSVSYFGAYWSTDIGYFDWWSPIISPQTSLPGGGILNFYDLIFDVNFETPPLEAEGELSIDFFRVVTYHRNTGAELNFAALNMAYTLFDNSLGTSSSQTPTAQALTYTAPNPDTGNNTRTDEYKVILGDGPTDAYPGHIEVSDGATWESSADWRLADAGTAYKLGQLFVRELMSMQRIPRTLYNGQIIGQAEPSAVSAPDAHERVEIRPGEFYFLLTGNLTLSEWRWSGTYMLVDKDIVGVTPDDEVSAVAETPIIGAPGTGGSGPPVIVDHPPEGVQLVQSGSFSSGYVSAGQLDILPLVSANVLPGQINEGDLIEIYNPVTGANFTFNAAADHPGGSGGIAAYTYISQDVPSNAVINVFQPQTTNGQINTADTVSQLVGEDSASITNAAYPAATVGELFTDEDAGNGSTSGLVLNGEGFYHYRDTETTPISQLLADGSFAQFLAVLFRLQASELTKEEGLFYVYKGFAPVLADLVATRPIEPVSKMFQFVGYNTNVTVSTLSEFWPVGLKWNSYRIGRYKITCQNYGAGSGNNQLKIFKNGVLQISAGFTITLWTSISVPLTMAFGDYFHFEVSAVRSTPPKGLVVELEFII